MQLKILISLAMYTFTIANNLQCLQIQNTQLFARGDQISICWHFITNTYITQLIPKSNATQDLNTTINSAQNISNSTNQNTNQTEIGNITTNASTVSALNTTTNTSNQSIATTYIDESAQRLIYNSTVDVYSVITANSAYNSLKNNNVSIMIQADSNSTQASSPVINYLNQTSNGEIVFPIFSLVITFNEGIIQQLIWDNGCWDSSADCSTYTAWYQGQNISYYETNNYYSSCNTTSNQTQSACDPKVYISFLGTDVNGNYMTSAGMRISQFKKYSIGSLFQSAKNAVTTQGSSLGSYVQSKV